MTIKVVYVGLSLNYQIYAGTKNENAKVMVISVFYHEGGTPYMRCNNGSAPSRVHEKGLFYRSSWLARGTYKTLQNPLWHPDYKG